MTAQVSEKLLYEGKSIFLFSEPLSLYLMQNQIRFTSPHTANWRGYVGTWEIIEADGAERLYLVGIEAHKDYETILTLPDLFPGFDKVFAHWFTGELRCPQGSLVEYVHMGYASTYEYELFLEFKQGVLVHKYAIHNKPIEKPEVSQPKVTALDDGDHSPEMDIPAWARKKKG
jgi:hypothetical protein